jgi:hypothetical protein
MGLHSVHHHARLAECALALACGADGDHCARFPGISGWLFGWSTQTIIATTIPCSLILALGYRSVTKPPHEHAFARCARVVALVGAIWLASALLIDALLGFSHLNPLKFYSASGFFGDMRFYLGWTLGLLLAPSAQPRRTDAIATKSG